jgi:hypothetical protein
MTLAEGRNAVKTSGRLGNDARTPEGVPESGNLTWLGSMGGRVLASLQDATNAARVSGGIVARLLNQLLNLRLLSAILTGWRVLVVEISHSVIDCNSRILSHTLSGNVRQNELANSGKQVQGSRRSLLILSKKSERPSHGLERRTSNVEATQVPEAARS